MDKEKTTNKGKKRKQDSLITAVIAVSATIAFMGGFALSTEMSRSYYNRHKSENTEIGDIGVAGGSLLGGTTLGFNENYIISNKEYDYNIELGTYAGVGDSYISLSYGENKSDIRVVKYYYDDENSEEYTISFDKNVVDVYMSTFDMDTDLNAILFLLDDGSVEYMFAENAIENDNYVTQGKIDGIESVVKFYDGTSCEKDTPICSNTTFAQSIDGKIYNLYDYIIE